MAGLVSRRLFLILCSRKPSPRAFHLASHSCRKEYDYDLDSLIKWKEETSKVFGPPRKLTKTGKVRKSRKELDKKIVDNLEILALLSEGDKSLETEQPVVPDQVILKSQPVDLKFEPKSLHTQEANLLEEQEGNDCDLPLETLRQTNDGWWVNNNDQQKSSLSESVDVVSGGKHSRLNDFPLGVKETVHIKSIKNEIEIPKLEAIPSAVFPPARNVQRKQFVSAPPLEAPLSFDLIPKYPLTPLSNKRWLEGRDAQKLHSFKREVELMSLRFLPSVKSVLSKTMPERNRFMLQRWREKMIKELGEEGFKKHNSETLQQGINLHDNIMEYLSGKSRSDLQILPENEGHWSSLSHALSSISGARAVELSIRHPDLQYRGVFDCVAQYKDLLCVIDWKVSKKRKPKLTDTYDDPRQVAAYVGAMNANYSYLDQYGELNHGLIVVAYPDGSPADIHMLSRNLLEQFWGDWTDRLHEYFVLTYTEKLAQKQEREDEAHDR